jgi:hypothetical protein
MSSNDPFFVQYQAAEKEYKIANSNVGFGITAFAISCLGTAVAGIASEENPEISAPIYSVGQVSIGVSILVTIALFITAVRKKRNLRLAENRLNGR